MEDAYVIGAIVFAALSEIIGMLPIKSNSVVQSIMSFGKLIFGKRNGAAPR